MQDMGELLRMHKLLLLQKQQRLVLERTGFGISFRNELFFKCPNLAFFTPHKMHNELLQGDSLNQRTSQPVQYRPSSRRVG